MAQTRARTLIDAMAPPNYMTAPPVVPLDSLPVEILMDVASWLDYWSLLKLECVSRRCRDAVALHLGRVRVFTIIEGTELVAPYSVTRDGEWKRLSRGQKVSLLSRLTALRELHVFKKGIGDGIELLQVLLAASTSWSRLEILNLGWLFARLDPSLLVQLCASCARLSDISLLFGSFTGEMVKAMLTARHELRSLNLNGTLKCDPGRVAAGLAGCVRLERLRLGRVLVQSSVTDRQSSVADCLPPSGLPALRHFSLSNNPLTDADLTLLVERLPNIESVSLRHVNTRRDDSRRLTSRGLALLGRLPALRSLSIEQVWDAVSDWALAQLSVAPLTELRLGGRTGFWQLVTAEGLYRVIQSCPALRWATLWNDSDRTETIQTIDCRSDAGEREFRRIFEDIVQCSHDGSWFPYCHLSTKPSERAPRKKSRS